MKQRTPDELNTKKASDYKIYRHRCNVNQLSGKNNYVVLKINSQKFKRE